MVVVSPVHVEEAQAISDVEERQEIRTVLERFGTRIQWDVAAARERTEGLHLCADRLVKKYRREKVAETTLNSVEFTIVEDLK